jgi:lia operon protein LiaG
MKRVKFGIIAFTVLLASGVASAQDYKVAVQNTAATRVILKDFNSQLPIEGYAGNEIVITSAAGKMEIPDKAKGLKPIFPGGVDNTGIGIDVQKSENTVTITCLVPFTRESEYKIKMPENVALEITSGCERSNDVVVTGMKNEIDIQICHNIELKDVTGPLVLSTIDGNIDVKFANINTSKTSSVKSVSGDVDISLPVKTPVNLELNTVSGTIYSDFDFSESKKDLRKIGGNETNYSLNGGGFTFSIKSVSGNVFLRKGN